MGGSPTQSMQDYRRNGMANPVQKAGIGVGGEMLMAPPMKPSTQEVEQASQFKKNLEKYMREHQASEYQKADMADKAAKAQNEYAPRD
jgi:hypothetical protein